MRKKVEGSSKKSNEEVVINKLSNYLPIPKLIGLMVLSFGFYFYYWYYKNLEYIEDYGKKDSLIWFRFIGILIPILNIYLIFDSIKDIKELVRTKRVSADLYR